MIEIFYYNHNKFSVAPHLQKSMIHFHELTFLLQGKMVYVIDEQEVPLSSGDAIYVRPGSTRERRPFADSDYISFNFYSEENFGLPVRVQEGISDEIKLLLSAGDEMYANLTNPNSFGCLDLLLQCIIKQLTENLHAKKLSPLTIKIKDYIRRHIGEKITLEKIGNALYFSPVYCSVLFKKEMGKSIMNYVIDEKIRKAKNYITEGENLKTAAERAGFTDYNYFCRLFRQRVKYTPAQYRKATFLSPAP